MARRMSQNGYKCPCSGNGNLARWTGQDGRHSGTPSRQRHGEQPGARLCAELVILLLSCLSRLLMQWTAPTTGIAMGHIPFVLSSAVSLLMAMSAGTEATGFWSVVTPTPGVEAETAIPGAERTGITSPLSTAERIADPKRPFGRAHLNPTLGRRGGSWCGRTADIRRFRPTRHGRSRRWHRRHGSDGS